MACLPGSSLTLLLLFSSAPPFRQSVIWWAFCLRKVFLLIRSLGVEFCHRHESVGAAVSTGLLPWVLAQECKPPYYLTAAVLLVGFVVTAMGAETKALPPLVAAGNVGGANEHSVSV